MIDITKIKALIESVIQAKGYELIAVKSFKEDDNTILQVIIDKPNLTVEDCVVVTNLINPILDENENLFKDTYILDVCSKGVEK